MKVSVLFTTLALYLGVASAQQLADDPKSYFGGINTEAYLDWLATNDIETKYNNSVYMPSIDPGLGAAVHWFADDEYFYVAVAARASGWVGFGLSDVGGMLGSDFALYSVNRPFEIVDAHAVETYYPKEDDCQRDWVYVNSSAASAPISISRGEQMPEAITGLGDDFIMFETRRKLVTDDPQDLAIVKDNLIPVAEQRIIAAWGDTPDVSFHGNNVARGSIRVYKHLVAPEMADFETAMAQHADGSFFVGARNYEIPANDTTYADFCVSRSDLIAMGVPDTNDMMSIIGFKPILDEGESAPYVHHYVVTGKFNSSDAACGEGEGPGFDMVFVWAPGDGGFALPEFLGGNLFGEDGFQSFNIEIHYDNPRLTEGVIDSSGVEIYYTTTHRPVEMGVLQVGDPFVGLFGQPVGAGLTAHHFECPGTCSDLYQNDGEPVTVIREYLHMHIAGARTTNEHIRNGTVIRTASTEVWEFDQNGNVPVKQQPFEILPGDSFRMSCYYRGNDDTVFGLSSREEMCMAFLYYYPRKTRKLETPDGGFNIPYLCGYGLDVFDNACFASYEPEGELLNDEGMNRIFGKQPEQCLIAADGASVADPAVVLEPPAPAPVDAVETETETISEPNPVPVPVPAPVPGHKEDEMEPEDDPIPAPAPADMEEFPVPVLESTSSASSVLSGAVLYVAFIVAAVL